MIMDTNNKSPTNITGTVSWPVALKHGTHPQFRSVRDAYLRESYRLFSRPAQEIEIEAARLDGHGGYTVVYGGVS